ncbi:MAG: DUF2785 domain-containing protein, partial [Chloroflexota bacterium]
GLRDDIAYGVYANWLKREIFTKEELRADIDKLLSNLNKGIGETESDTVFLRTFSVLLLAEIVHNDNKKPLLEKNQIQTILSKGLWYLDAEKDPRGHIPVKSWAHALAHTADLMLVLGKNRGIDKEDLENILHAIAKKLVTSTNWIYIYGEDDRLASAVITIFKRDLLTVSDIKHWLESLTSPDLAGSGMWQEEERARVYFNVRNFLRSVHLHINAVEKLPNKTEIQSALLEANQELQRY